MEHYICTGSCHGKSAEPKNCGDNTCDMYGKPLTPCGCADDKHGKEEEPKDKEEQTQGQ